MSERSEGGEAHGPALVLGLGITGRAVARALVRRGDEVVLVDDAPNEPARALAAELGATFEPAPGPDRLAQLLAGAAIAVPSPGVPERHPLFALAAEASVPIVSELDLAAAWDERPCLAVTGTDGKTTVVTLVTDMLRASGIVAVSAGNTEVPLVEAIDDPEAEVFVVEASSFRLAAVRRFRPEVGTWLNFAADHQDVHLALDGYERAKARIWAGFGPGQLAIANADDPVVMRNAEGLPRLETFGLGGLGTADWHVRAGSLRSPDGEELVAIDGLWRRFPHDLANALAAAATAVGGGASRAAVRSTLLAFRGLPHRVTLVGEAEDVRYYDDSKATVPHATGAAVAGFESVVLIAGGRNKGVDLTELAALAPRLRAVVAIGEAAAEVEAAFAGLRPVEVAESMDDAVERAGRLARAGDAVLLSPGCASFDWYRSYGERGDDFARAVRELVGSRGS